MLKHADWLTVVCNGKLTEEGRRSLEQLADSVIVRENVGFDVWAYREGLLSIGWDKLSGYDEVILENSTIMGPISTFDELFDRMSQKDVDFWGITTSDSNPVDPTGRCPYGFMPEHIQSSFTAIRSSLFKDREFIHYWENLPAINSYEDSIGLHEMVFTKHFSDRGFAWDAYIDPAVVRDSRDNPLISCPKWLAEEMRCPIFKRRLFFQDYDYLVTYTLGTPTDELYRYLRDETEYEVDMIWENILRTCHMSDIVKTMHLSYVIPHDCSPDAEADSLIAGNPTAFVIHLYDLGVIGQILSYAASLPSFIDLYVTTNTPEKKLAIERFFSVLPNRLEVRIIENRGRDVASLLVGVKDIIPKYSIVGYIHDKKTAYLKPESIGQGFAYKCLENTLASECFVRGTLALFAKYPRLGLLCPCEPNHGDFFPHIGNEWEKNYEITVELAKKLGLAVPIRQDKEPIAPFGSYFWFRTDAMKALYDADWTYEDFPPEPLAVDGTLLHAVERVYPFVAQHEGYYTAYLFSDSQMSAELTNLFFYARGYSHVMAENGVQDYYYKMRNVFSIMWDENSALHQMIADHRAHLDFLDRKIGASRQSVKKRVRLSMRRRMPRWFYGSAVFVKRALIGPRNIPLWPSEEELNAGVDHR